MIKLRKIARTALSALAPNIAHSRRIKYATSKEKEIELLKFLCRGDRLAIDVGANQGLYVDHLLRITPHVVAFEPLPSMQRLLSRFYGERITLELFALSDANGKVEIRMPRGNPSWATIAATNSLDLADSRMGIETALVEQRTLDSYNYKNVDFIKIDVEGNEEFVLHGSSETLQRERPNLIVEIEERHNKGAITRIEKMMGLLGYDAYFISGCQLLPISDFNPDRDQRVENVGENGKNGRYINNFIFIPKATSSGVAQQMQNSLI